MVKQYLKSILNRMLAGAGVKVVSCDWGPRGFVPIIETICDAGIELHQVIDVGASDGIWTLECREVLPLAKYFMIDPLPVNHSPLAEIVRQNAGYGYFAGGVGAKSGRMKLYSHGDQSSVHPSVFASTPDSCIEIEVKTLDEMLTAGLFENPDFIKLDVQGHELEVFRGAEKCLDHAKVLLVETHIQPSYQETPFIHEVVCHLAGLGFQMYDICSYVQRPIDRRLAQMDVVFAKPDVRLYKPGWD